LLGAEVHFGADLAVFVHDHVLQRPLREVAVRKDFKKIR
jgi:hypothetical protein